MKNYQRWCGILVVCICVLFEVCGCGDKSSAKVYTREQESDTPVEKEMEETTHTKEATIYVQITGAVKQPGVYQVSDGIRVFEALEYAGGATEEGDTDAVNLVRPVSDEMQIYIPTYEEVAKSEEVSFWQDEYLTGETEDSLVNINQADKNMLMTLPGIGESRAEAIIAYREENGAFQDVEDIKKISGIKDAAFEKIKNRIKV